MARPTKPIQLVKGHRTKAEKQKREKEEKRLMTGISFKESPDVADDPIAHKEFFRLKKLFKKIDKDEGLQENVINRYCKLHSECFYYAQQINDKKEDMKTLMQTYSEGGIDPLIYIASKDSILNLILQCDKKIMDKRKMMLDIEKENIMTVAATLRSIQKKPEESKEKNPFANLASYKR
jgi:phage terminase small subunit